MINAGNISPQNQKRKMYNHLALIMYYAVQGIFANLFFILIVYLTPLAIKQIQELLPHKVVNVNNFAIKYRIIIFTPFIFLLVTNMRTIINCIIVMINNPL